MCQVLTQCGFSGVSLDGNCAFEVILRPTLGQSDVPSDLRGSLSPTTRHRCTHVLVYTAPGRTGGSPIQPGLALFIISDQVDTDFKYMYSYD